MMIFSIPVLVSVAILSISPASALAEEAPSVVAAASGGAVVSSAAAVSASGESPLARRYKEGETLRYRFEGSSVEGKEEDHWSAVAVSTVKKDENGTFHEELRWTKVRRDGKSVKLPPESRDFRQLLSLDPKFKVSLPDLSRLDPSLSSPMLDTLNFYADEQLVIRKGLREPGDHLYLRHGRPNSWADGSRVTAGYDCIDFDLTLAGLSADRKTATIKVGHVPPAKGCEKVPADWMRKPAFDTENNWYQVVKEGEGRYMAGAGKEVFDVELKVRLPSGVIESAVMSNPVDIVQRVCKDAALSDCGAPEKSRVFRAIKITLD